MSKDKSIEPDDLPASVRQDKTEQPEELIDNDTWQGVAKAPDKENAETEKIAFSNLENERPEPEPPAAQNANATHKIEKDP